MTSQGGRVAARRDATERRVLVMLIVYGALMAFITCIVLVIGAPPTGSVRLVRRRPRRRRYRPLLEPTD